MTRITAEHLSREAWVYVRQSTPDQIRHNRESRGRQYGLEGRARELGWRDVVVVDDDLGQSGTLGDLHPGVSILLSLVVSCNPGEISGGHNAIVLYFTFYSISYKAYLASPTGFEPVSPP